VIEKHYTIPEVAGVLSISRDRAWKLVKGEPGVLRIAPEGKSGKPAGKMLYRIPESVLQRILKRNANPA
jgi:hypothetical protein